MAKILTSLEAAGSMVADCYSADDANETGGILVGPAKHKQIITDIVPSTLYAGRGPASYVQTAEDVKILNQSLADFQRVGYDFKGYYHKHPSGYYALSSTDKNTCEKVLKSPNYKINNYLVMCIVTNSATQAFPLFTYRASLINHDGILELDTRKVEVAVLPKSCIIECLQCLEFVEDEVSHEDIHSQQYHGRDEVRKASKTIWHQKRIHNHFRLTRKPARARRNRVVPNRRCAINRSISRRKGVAVRH